MAKIYLDELVAAMNFSTFSSLEADGQEANQAKQTIDEFISGSTSSLKGAEWNAVRNKLSVYSNALSIRVKAGTGLSSAIQGALKMLIDYMGEYEMLDSSKLEEIKGLRSQCLSSINNLRGMLGQANQEDSDFTVADINSQISLLEDKIVEIDKLIVKLEGLDAVYSSAEQMISGALAEVQEFANSVSQIVPSQTVMYVPS